MNGYGRVFRARATGLSLIFVRAPPSICKRLSLATQTAELASLFDSAAKLMRMVSKSNKTQARTMPSQSTCKYHAKPMHMQVPCQANAHANTMPSQCICNNYAKSMHMQIPCQANAHAKTMPSQCTCKYCAGF